MSRFCVLLSIYNGESVSNFRIAICSIWDEQVLKPNEIILVQDGPISDELSKEIQKLEEKLKGILRVIKLERNNGLAYALNEGLKYCKYDLVARMDTDDISLPNRFQEQVDFMEKNEDISVSSGYIEEWNEDLSHKIYTKKLPIDEKKLHIFAKKRCPLVHPAVIFRKSAVLAVGGYPDFKKAQDYALWSKMLVSGYNIVNIPKVLLKMRAGESLMSRRSLSYLRYELQVIKFQYQIGFLNIFEFFRNVLIKFLLRILPTKIKKLIYLKLRG